MSTIEMIAPMRISGMSVGTRLPRREAHLPRRESRMPLREAHQPLREAHQPRREAPLTRRERVVLSNLSEDVTLEQIATKLFVTRNTVKSQVRSLYRKIGVSTRAEAVAWAEAAGMR